MSPAAERAAQAEGCVAIVDDIDGWVRGESAEAVAERVMARLPKELRVAIRVLVMRETKLLEAVFEDMGRQIKDLEEELGLEPDDE